MVIFAVPPLVKLVPTVLPFGVEIVTAGFGFVAVLAMLLDGLVEPGFRLLDRMLAPRPIVVGVHQRHRDEPEECSHHYCRNCRSCHSLNQVFLLIYECFYSGSD
jgi:hypothetical protein